MHTARKLKSQTCTRTDQPYGEAEAGGEEENLPGFYLTKQETSWTIEKSFLSEMRIYNDQVRPNNSQT